MPRARDDSRGWTKTAPVTSFTASEAGCGRSDREEFLKRRVGLGGLAAAAVSRGALSILPMVVDLGTYALGMDPLFDTRVSGGAVQGIESSPVVGLGNMVFNAMHGISASARGDGAFTQRDARAIQGLLPFSNFLPAVWATNAMIGGLPYRDTHMSTLR